MSKETKEPKESKSIWDLLRERFAAPTYAYLEEVRNGTGYQRRQVRTADALAYCTWPSRGLELHGIEVKVSRSDWIKERDDPDKSAEIQRFCDRWWLAIDDEKIVEAGELPPAWGLLVRKGAKLICKVDAPKIEAQPLDRLMLAAILRNVTDRYMPRSNIRKEIEQARSSAYEQGAKSRDGELERTKRELNQIKGNVREYEQASGLNLDVHGWNGHAKRVGAAVQLIIEGGVERHRRDLQAAVSQARSVVASMERLLRGMEETPEATPGASPERAEE